MLEEDYLKNVGEGLASSRNQNNKLYEFKDPRAKELNTYSTQLIKELIIPKLTQEINSSKRYAQLRQVYYSLIMAQWFKARFGSQKTEDSSQKTEKNNGQLTTYDLRQIIDSKNLTGLTSKTPWSKETYYKEYQKSFKDGEYNVKQTVSTPTGQVIRSYFSGGESLVKMAASSSGIIENGIVSIQSFGFPVVDNSIKDNLVEMVYDGNVAVSSVVENITRRDFLKLTIAAMVTPLISTEAIAAVFKILGIPLKDIDSESDPRVKIVEEAIEKLLPWELELLRRFKVSFEPDVWRKGEAIGTKILLHEKKGFDVSIILHEIGHVIYGFISVLKKEWLANIIPLVEKIVEEYYRYTYSLGSNDKLIVEVDMQNDEIKIYMKRYFNSSSENNFKDINIPFKKEGEFIYIEEKSSEKLQHWIRFLNDVISGTGEIISYYSIKNAYKLCNAPNRLFIKRWYDINEKNGIYYNRYNNEDTEIIYLPDNPKRPKGFSTPYAQRAFWEELAEFFAFSHLNPEGLKQLIKTDEIVREKWELLEEFTRELRDSIDNAKNSSSSLTKGVEESEFFDAVVSQSIASVPLPANNYGGIDFRFLPIVTQAVTNLNAHISSSSIHNLSGINLNQEWQNIERMASSGIKVSGERIKEYIQAVCLKGNIIQLKDKVISYISDILRQDEEQGALTVPMLRDILVVLESVTDTRKLKEIFLGG